MLGKVNRGKVMQKRKDNAQEKITVYSYKFEFCDEIIRRCERKRGGQRGTRGKKCGKG